ncbi:hypothetical protein [Methylobacter sp. S3L5C]|uniref:hypothetical protein n=1 Tax=Methylobacter sp. S3L5C TaxID=2839024 RepID=UPI001FAB9023|nr:hypothetical protein [Methylobacter sp. S3L5C]UOA08076.1 hypothetical protein KKZ03_17855 [Methylobacter sp. S3L5C]
MKNLIQILTLVTVFLLSIAPSHAAIISFSLDTASNQVQVGDSFDVDVIVHDLFANDLTDSLLAFGLNALYSTNGLLAFTGSTINPLFEDNSVNYGLNAAGWVYDAITNDVVVGQTLTLASLHFQALAAGNVSIFVDSELSDFNQGLTFLNQDRSAINVSSNFTISAVPLPPALLIFISGLVGMSFSAFRKRFV